MDQTQISGLLDMHNKASKDLVQEKAFLDRGFELLKDISIDELIRTETLGENDFSETKQDLENMLAISNRLSELPFEIVGIGDMTEIALKIHDVLSICLEIAKYSIKNDTGEVGRSSNKRNIEQRIVSVLRELRTLTQTLSWIHFIRSDEVSESIRSKITESEEAIKELNSKLEKADEILSSMDEASKRMGAKVHSTLFDNEATRYKEESIKWLKATLASLTVMLGFLIYIYSDNKSKGSISSETALTISSRLAILALLSFAVAFCARQYSVSRHNQTINTHKALSLDTFKTFVLGTEDQTIKDAVLLEATKAIFTPQATGYIKNDEGSVSSPNIINEVYKQIPK